MMLDYELTRFIGHKTALLSQINMLETEIQAKIRRLEESANKLGEAQDRILISVAAYKKQCERSSNTQVRKAERRIKELEKQLKAGGVQSRDDTDIAAIARGRTLSIFDTILFSISNWSTAGDAAPDFELISQSILFPVVYEQVVSGNEDYILDSMPACALEVIHRGREWVRHLRQNCDRSLVDPVVWAQYQNSIVQWWLNDALPLIYDVRGEDWDDIEPFSQQEMIAWRDFPAQRPLSFPLIFDGMETVTRLRNEIRETSGIPELDKKATQTRLDPL